MIFYCPNIKIKWSVSHVTPTGEGKMRDYKTTSYKYKANRFKISCPITCHVNDRKAIFFFFFFSIWLDDPHLTNEHRTQDCSAS